MSTMTGGPSVGQVGDLDRGGEPGDDEVRRMHLEDEGGLRPDRLAVVAQRGSGWSCRPRAAGRRWTVSRSGMRKPSPISTSSPRLTMISRPRASASPHSSSAAALLLTTCTASASGTAAASASSAPRPRRARSPVASSNSTSVAPAATASASRAGGGERGPAEVGVDDHPGRVDDLAEAGRVAGSARDRGVARPRPGPISPRRARCCAAGDDVLDRSAGRAARQPRRARAGRAGCRCRGCARRASVRHRVAD